MTEEAPSSEPAAALPTWPPVQATLIVAVITTVVVTAISYLAPEDYANTAVGAAFLGATWFTALRSDTSMVRAYGLSLGGLTEPAALSPKRLVVDFFKALGWAVLLGAIFLPPFWYGYVEWWDVQRPFSWRLAFPPDMPNRVLTQILVIALPEEAFFRGFLQSALDGAWAKRRIRVLGAELGPGWILAAAIFAIGHILTIINPARLAVFFPGLLFGWVRARTGGIGAAVLFHALCNLFSATLARGYGLG